MDGQNAGHRSIKIVNEPPKLLEVELLSSKSKVSATVDGATVSFDKHPVRSHYRDLVVKIVI